VPYYDEVRSFSEGLAAVSLDGKWGFMDKNGVMVIPHMYRMPVRFQTVLRR